MMYTVAIKKKVRHFLDLIAISQNLDDSPKKYKKHSFELKPVKLMIRFHLIFYKELCCLVVESIGTIIFQRHEAETSQVKSCRIHVGFYSRLNLVSSQKKEKSDHFRA